METTWRFVPLAGALFFFGLGLAVRSWLHMRRHGSSGVTVFRGRPRSERLLGLLGIAVPVMLLAQTTVAAVAPDAIHLVVTASVAHVLRPFGAALLFGGTLLMFVAQLDLGASWRVGLDHQTPGALVTRGLYGYSRNPIYLFMFVAFAGLALLLPTWPLLVTLLGGAIGFRWWVAEVEEAHLVTIYGDAYRGYAASVGRFLPWFGRLR